MRSAATRASLLWHRSWLNDADAELVYEIIRALAPQQALVEFDEARKQIQTIHEHIKRYMARKANQMITSSRSETWRDLVVRVVPQRYAPGDLVTENFRINRNGDFELRTDEWGNVRPPFPSRGTKVSPPTPVRCSRRPQVY